MAGEHALDTHNGSWLFPPETRDVQLDEKWSFVAKKQAHCEPTAPADAHNRGLVDLRRL